MSAAYKRRQSKGDLAKKKAAFSDSANSCNRDELMKVFNKIDLDHSQSLDIGELEAAARELGVKCSKNSMRKIFKMVDMDGSGEIEFEEFFVFFGQVSDPEKMKNLLDSFNQCFFDYRLRVEQDPNFSKDFPCPTTNSHIQKYANHGSDVDCVQWVGPGQFVSCTGDGQILLWDASAPSKTPISKNALGAKKGVYCAEAMTGTQKLIFGLGASSENLWLWDMETSSVVTKWSGNETSIYSLASYRNSVVSGSKNGGVVFSDISTSQVVARFDGLHDNVVYSCSFSEDGRQVCTASRDGNVHVVDARDPTYRVATLEDAAAGYAVSKALWLEDREVMTCGDDFCIKRWDLRMPTDPPIACYLGLTTNVTTLALSADRTFFVSGTFDGSVRLWFTDANGIREANQAGSAAVGVDAKEQLQTAKADFETLMERVFAGEADSNDAKAAASEIERLEAKVAVGEEVEEKGDQNRIGASLDLSGHKMAITSLAWQDTASGTAYVVSGSKDESACLFEVNTRDLLSSIA